MRQEAEARRLPVFAPESINTDEAREQIKQFRPDLLVVCDYGQILSAETLATAPLGGINLHASLLPKYRGAAPFQWAIYHGETETGNSVIHMTPGLDAGPIIAQNRTSIGPDETAAELEPRLAEMGAGLVLEAVEKLATGTAQPIPQDKSQATKAPRLKKEDGQIDWSRTAAEIKNQVRAFNPWPRTYTDWHRERREPLRLIVHRVQLAAPTTSAAAPGMVLETVDRLTIATGGGALELVEVQPAGKRALSAADFLRGYSLQPGDRLG